MIKRKSWHLSDFKETSRFMYIVLEEYFHRKFYSTAIQIAGSERKLAKKLGFYPRSINNYIHKIRRPSLNSIIKISNFLVVNGKMEFDIKEIEKHVIKIKVNGQPVSISPKFPIVLNEDLVRIVANIIGDGGINNCFNPFYCNKDFILTNNFKKYMKNIFGCGPLVEYGFERRNIMWYPNIIGKMLIEMFGSFSFSKVSKYIPDEMVDSNEELKTNFLNSLYGDEGSTLPYQIGLYQGKKNLRLLFQTKFILNKLDIKTNNILKISKKSIMIDPRTKKEYPAEEMYVLTISGYKEIIKFRNKIGFPSGSVKENNFLNMLKTKYPKEVKRNKVGETKDLILDIINKKPKSIKAISHSLGFSKEIIYYHIKELKLQNKVSFEEGLVELNK